METNKNPSNYGDSETPSTARSVSIGGTVIITMKYYIKLYSIVQVPNDSDMPDNIYTGEVYYERTSSNKWLMRFMTVQNLKVFQQVI